MKPIIIIGAPRSGTTLIFSILSSHPRLWSLYDESWIIDKYFHPQKHGWGKGNMLAVEDASHEIIETLKLEFYKMALNYQIIFPNLQTKIYTNLFREAVNRKIFQSLISPYLKPQEIRLVEKSPKNCLRIPFLDVLFPDAIFIFLTRDPRTNISSLLEGWRKNDKYQTYRLPVEIEIKGYKGKMWKFLLPPGWEEYVTEVRLKEVCVFWYRVANKMALESLSNIADDPKMILRYEDLIVDSKNVIKRICSKVQLSYSGGLKGMAEKMPPVNTSSRPNRNKWKKNEHKVMSVIETVREVSERLGYVL